MGMPEFYNLQELEDLAVAKLPKMVYDYYAGGAESGFSVQENLNAFQRWRLLPRMLVDVSKLETTRSLLGLNFSFPAMVAPMAMQGMAHPGGEVAMAKAAMAVGVPMAHSTVSTSSLQEVAASGHAGLIFQLYVVRNRDVVRAWVQEAEQLGYRALMVTVDAQRLGRREADERNRFALPHGLSLKTVEKLRGSSLTQARQNVDGSGLGKLFAAEVDDTLTWAFIPWLRSITSLPIIIKGVLAPEDAELALQYGVDGIVVSNHGGRQLDYAPAALDMLPAIARVVNRRVPLLVDGGVRRGTDMLKALALGADAVLVGRPLLYALAIGGQAGVEKALSLLRAEFELAMALAGCPTLQHISPKLLLPAAGLPPAAADRLERGHPSLPQEMDVPRGHHASQPQQVDLQSLPQQGFAVGSGQGMSLPGLSKL